LNNEQINNLQTGCCFAKIFDIPLQALGICKVLVSSKSQLGYRLNGEWYEQILEYTPENSFNTESNQNMVNQLERGESNSRRPYMMAFR